MPARRTAAAAPKASTHHQGADAAPRDGRPTHQSGFRSGARARGHALDSHNDADAGGLRHESNQFVRTTRPGQVIRGSSNWNETRAGDGGRSRAAAACRSGRRRMVGSPAPVARDRLAPRVRRSPGARPASPHRAADRSECGKGLIRTHQVLVRRWQVRHGPALSARRCGNECPTIGDRPKRP
jgi:hypothetical protein